MASPFYFFVFCFGFFIRICCHSFIYIFCLDSFEGILERPRNCDAPTLTTTTTTPQRLQMNNDSASSIGWLPAVTDFNAAQNTLLDDGHITMTSTQRTTKPKIFDIEHKAANKKLKYSPQFRSKSFVANCLWLILLLLFMDFYWNSMNISRWKIVNRKSWSSIVWRAAQAMSIN